MKPAPFDYTRPKDLAEAIAALGQDGKTTAAIAGGQSILPLLNLRVSFIDLLVDIGRLDELRAVSAAPSALHIGALTTHAAIEDGQIPDLFAGLLPRVASQIAYRTIRHHGTIGGSVALADPAADWPGCLMALGATVRIAGPAGQRCEPVENFILDTYATSLATGEIILGFDVPRPDGEFRWGVAKVARKSGAYANSLAFAVAQGGAITVVLAGAGPRARPLPTLAETLRGGKSSEESLRAAIAADLAAAAPDADPYQQRLHTATLLRAVREMRAQ